MTSTPAAPAMSAMGDADGGSRQSRPAADTVPADLGFEEFHRQHRDRLVRTLALHLHDLDLATEAVDVALGRAWHQWSRLDDHHDAGSWVYRVAVNWATSWFRRRRWISREPVPDLPVEPTLPEVRPRLRAALAGLDPDLRAVVVLRHYADLSTADTAAALDIPIGTVKSRLARALDRLRTDLEA